MWWGSVLGRQPSSGGWLRGPGAIRLATRAWRSARGVQRDDTALRTHELLSWRPSGGLEGETMGGESVERGQRRDGERSDQEIERGLRHAADKAAHVVQVAQARGMQDPARSEKQEHLEHGVVERVVEGGDQGEHSG